MTVYKIEKWLNSVLRLPSRYQRILLVMLVLLLLLTLARSTALSQPPEGPWRYVRTIYTADFGASHPAGLSFLPDANIFVTQPDQAALTELVMITMYAEPAGTLNLSEPVADPLNVTFDGQANRLVIHDPAAGQFVEIEAGASGIPDPSRGAAARYSVRPFGMQQARGMTIDPQSGRLYILNAAAQHITRVTPHPASRFDGDTANRDGRIAQINLRQLNAVDLRGIAYNPGNQHLYVLDAAQHIVYELAEDGQLVATRDLSELNLRDPQGMVIAPSVDRTDDPTTMNLFILDSGQPSSENTTSESARIVELSLLAPTALPPGTTLLPATLVTTVDTSIAAWNPSSPDPAGITYWPLTGRLLVVDSEVNEMPPYWQGVNVFGATTSGTLVSTCTTFTSSPVTGAWNNYSNEPTGVAINPNNNFIYVASDSGGGRVHEVRPGPDGTYCTPDDVVTTINFSTDVEDIAYGNNRLFIAGGVDAEVWTWDLGPNGVLGGGDDGPVTHFDTLSLGFTDLEAIAYNWDAGTLFIASATSSERYLGEVTASGTLLRAYDLGFMGSGARKRSGMTYAPGSLSPAVRNIYIVSRNIDNGQDPLENDGQWWEVSLGNVQPTPTNTPPPGPTSTPTSTATSGPSSTPTNTPIATNTPGPTNTPSPTDNLLENPGFELDANNDGWPDVWTTDPSFSRSNALVLNGSYAGRYFSTSGASANVRQTINNLTAGTTYVVSGWVNIPQPAGSSLSFQPKVEWRNGSTLIYRESLKKYTGVTNGWDQLSGSLVAPAGTTNARLVLTLTGLNGTIYLDDFSFGPQGSTPPATNTPTNTPVPATATNTPTNTPVSPPATNTPTNTPVSATATNTPTNTPVPPTATNMPPSGSDVIHLSFTANGSVGGISFADEDIVAFNTNTGTWSLYFDGSDVGLGSNVRQNIDAFFIMPDNTILISISGDTTIPDLGSVDNSDIVRFVPTSLGSNTAGTFEWYFDGSDVGLAAGGENLDAVTVLANGNLIISTSGSYSVPGVSGADEDLLQFTPTSLGANTTGTWSLYFDGSDVGLDNTSNENVIGTWIDEVTGNIYLTTQGAFSVNSLSGDGADIFICSPLSLGSVTSCNFSPYLDGSTVGLAGQNINGFSIAANQG